MFSGASVKASPCQTPQSLPDSLIKYVSVSSLRLILSDTKFKGSMGMYMTLVTLVFIPLSKTHQLRSRMSGLQISTTRVLVNRASFLYFGLKRLPMFFARPLLCPMPFCTLHWTRASRVYHRLTTPTLLTIWHSPNLARRARMFRKLIRRWSQYGLCLPTTSTQGSRRSRRSRPQETLNLCPILIAVSVNRGGKEKSMRGADMNAMYAGKITHRRKV
ncbi:hypothetical protein K469DRAFT_211562 [Zopfia rhizophila CBS 207.26]|uniref:Uncharacterized protein n=1 Tax=Zopfia rhizophila CBS 207.26 TaxID=1314779 RepID=A0A6A6DYG1_9PEZI|nr:hypothetical protein K469DRAFT_211562 [Zopfia rhizophila CBS 207.26]